MDRRSALTLFAQAAFAGARNQTGSVIPNAAQQQRLTWVAGVLERMQHVKPGMKRIDLLQIFTTEGGISNRTQQTFVSQDCPYFKVDAIFRVKADPSQDPSQVPSQDPRSGDSQDEIVSLSRPYLQLSILD